jgi:hypothetical protein
MNASSDDDDDSDDEDALDISDNVCYLQGRPQIISDDRLIAARIRIATAFDEADDNDEESDEENGVVLSAGVFDDTVLRSDSNDLHKVLRPLRHNPDLFFLPGTFPGVRVQIKRIRVDDPRESLRGQFGLFAGVGGIPKFTIIAPYAGWLRFGRDIDAELSSTNPTVRARAREAQEYMLHVGQFKLRELSGKDARGNDSIVSDGSGDLSIQAHPNMGNETMFINDAIGLRDENERVNTTFVQVIHDGWPYIFVVSTRNIAANDELLISYGEVFWQTTKEKKGGAGRWLRFIAFVFVAIGSPVLIAIGLLMITGRLPNGRSNGR